MLTVYAIPVSLYCAKLRILLRHKGLDWQEIPPPGGYGSDEYKTIIPSGNLPALDDAGLLIGDSEVIAEYLNEKFPDPPMLPDDPGERARVRELSRFHDTRLEPEVRKLFPHIDPASRDRAIIDAQSTAISARLRQLGWMLESRDLPDEPFLTLGDCGFPVTFTWIEALENALGLTIEWPPGVDGYRRYLGRIAPIREELASYRPTLEDWLAQETAA